MRSLAKTQLDKVLTEHQKALLKLNADDVQTLIDNDVPLSAIISSDVLDSAIVHKLFTVDANLLVEALQKHHPGLAYVLGTPRGVAWLEGQK